MQWCNNVTKLHSSSSHFFILDHRQLLLLYVSLTVGQVDTHPVTGKFRNKTMTVIWSWAKFKDQTGEAIRQKQSAVLPLVHNNCSCHLSLGCRCRTMTPSSPIAKNFFCIFFVVSLQHQQLQQQQHLMFHETNHRRSTLDLDKTTRQEHLNSRHNRSPYTGTELENLILNMNVSRVCILDSQAWCL